MQNTQQPQKEYLELRPQELVDDIRKKVDQTDFSHVQGEDVVIVIGPTGAAKSTILNAAAGSQVTFELDQQYGSWIATAKPQIFPIGHKESCTFLPKLWKNKKTNFMFGDCPGLNDTRGILHEILKSFFLKQLVKTTKSLRILLICDLPSIQSGREGNFGKFLQHVQKLFPKLSLQNETKLMVTKATDEIKSKMIMNIMKKLGIQNYMQENIKVIMKPSSQTKILPSIDFDNFVKDIPSIKHQCKLLITNEAKQKLRQFLRGIQFIPTIQTIIEKIQCFYFEFLQASLDQETSVISSAFHKIKQFQQGRQNVENRKGFIDFLQNGIKKLNLLDQKKTQIEAGKLIQSLLKKLESYEFIVEMLSDNDADPIHQWKNMFKINISEMKKSKDKVVLKGIENYLKHLELSGINGRQDLKQSVHKILAHPHQFVENYSGTKNQPFQYKVQKSSSISKTWSDIRTLKRSENVKCTGRTQYSEQKTVRHHETLRYCNHTFCWISNHDYKDYYGNTNVSCSGSKQVSKYVDHNVDKTFKVELSKTVPIYHSETINETHSIGYKDSHSVSCSDHHNCKCQDLVSFIIPIKDILQDMDYLQNIHEQQFSLLELNDTIQSKKQQILADLKSRLQPFSIDINSIIGEKGIGAKTIHQKLTNDYSFSAKYQGHKQQVVPYQFSRKVKYGGEQTVTGSLDYQANIPFTGHLDFNQTRGYLVTIYKASCRFCTKIKDNQQNKFNGTTIFHIKKDYCQTFNFKKQYTYHQKMKYQGEQTLQFSGTNKIPVSYSGSHTVQCKKGGLGHGHHDCRSCTLWECILKCLKELVQERQKLVTAIRGKEDSIKEFNLKKYH